MDALRAEHPAATLTLWAMDEHRLGLLPVTRRVWAKRGQRPTAWVRRRYQWLYVFGFVRPRTGQTWWCLLPTVNAPVMSVALAAFAQDCGIDAHHRVALVLDGAGWHTAKDLVIPEGLQLVFLPPASPELQPAERLWPLIDEPIANRSFADLDELEEVLVTRCQVLAANRRTSRPTPGSTGGPGAPSSPECPVITRNRYQSIRHQGRDMFARMSRSFVGTDRVSVLCQNQHRRPPAIRHHRQGASWEKRTDTRSVPTNEHRTGTGQAAPIASFCQYRQRRFTSTLALRQPGANRTRGHDRRVSSSVTTSPGGRTMRFRHDLWAGLCRGKLDPWLGWGRPRPRRDTARFRRPRRRAARHGL